VLVGALWGCTNPLIKKGSSGVQNVKSSNRVFQFFKELYFLVTNWRVSHLFPGKGHEKKIKYKIVIYNLS